MGVIKLFVQQKCNKCPQAKEVGNTLKNEGFEVMEYDIRTADGMAEAAFHSIQTTPAIILEDSDENIIADFRGEIPTPQEVKDLLSGAQD
jgi:glutaredoxin